MLLAPGRPRPWAIRGEIRAAMGSEAGAVEDLERSLRLAPADWESRAAVAALLDRLKAGGDGPPK